MRKALFFSCVVPSLIFALPASPRPEDLSSISNRLGFLRTLNTMEYSYQEQNGRFADGEQILTYLRKEGDSKRADELEHSESFQLSVTTSWDGAHYQIALTPVFGNTSADAENACNKAVFSDDRGVIFVGIALGCKGAEE